MTTLDPITIEVIGASLASIVDEAGETLIRASHSTNIKERRDCSTALFNAAGETLCQAEHIPIHLGSFLDLVPHIMRRYATQDIRPGDAFIGNDAYEGGGTHLPDIVLAEPIFILDSDTIKPDSVELYRMDVRSGHREVKVSGGSRKSTKALRLSVTKLDRGLYKLEASETLDPGEYSLSPTGANHVFCFEVY